MTKHRKLFVLAQDTGLLTSRPESNSLGTSISEQLPVTGVQGGAERACNWSSFDTPGHRIKGTPSAQGCSNGRTHPWQKDLWWVTSPANPKKRGPLSAGRGDCLALDRRRKPWIAPSSLRPCSSTMVSDNLPVLMILLLPAILLGSEGSHSLGEASPGATERTSKLLPEPAFIQSLRTFLLRRLSLQRRPEPKPGHAVPQYLLDLVRFHSGRAPSLRGAEFPFPVQHAGKANTVRAFHHLDGLGYIPEAREIERLFYFVFNISAVPEEEELMALELRLYHKEKRNQGLHINLYHAMDLSYPDAGKNRLLHRRFLALDQPKWESFDVTAAFKWIKGKRGNLGFLVEVVHVNGSHALQHQNGHLRVRRSPGEKGLQWALERPLLVTYTHDSRGQSLTPRSKQSRSHPASPTQQGGRRTGKPPGLRSKRKSQKQTKKGSVRCRRHPLFVDFGDMGWNDWIVAPNGYHAFYCSGDCRFPLADHMNSSNHAMVQTLLSSVNSSVPRACCVPTQLSPLAMLYLDQHDMVVLKTYQDMVVEGCGCQ